MKYRFIAVFILIMCHTAYPQSHDPFLNHLSGIWYEVALYPPGLRKDCHCTTLEFEYIPGRTYLTMTARCIQFRNNKSKILKNRLKLYVVTDTTGILLKTGRLKGEYYQVDQVGSEGNFIFLRNTGPDNLHILSRDAYVPVHKYNEVLKLLSQKGYNSSSIQKTSQNCDIIE